MSLCSIMIVDDCETDRYLLKRLIKKSKIKSKIHEAENGQVALDFFTNHIKNIKKHPESHFPFLIFLDINMPIMDGFEFLEKFSLLKEKNKELGTVIFTMITSSEKIQDIKKAQSYGFMQDFLTKGSLTVDILKKIVSKKIDQIEFDH